jgi:hypothetical protein
MPERPAEQEHRAVMALRRLERFEVPEEVEVIGGAAGPAPAELAR